MATMASEKTATSAAMRRPSRSNACELPCRIELARSSTVTHVKESVKSA